MAQVIEIEGELVSFIDRTVSRQVQLSELLPLLENRVVVEVPSLPRTSVFVRYDGRELPTKLAYFLCEIAPGIKNIIKNGRRYRLAMPWTYFWFTASTSGTANVWAIDDYRCFHALEQYKDMDSQMVRAFLPNLYDEGRICFGATGAPANLPLGERIDFLVNNWYLTNFNSDLDSGGMYPERYKNTAYKVWVEESRENSNIWTAWEDWAKYDLPKFTVKELVADSTPRPTMAMTSGRIPEIVAPFTFGRAEQWLTSIKPQERGRLYVALQNLMEEQPEIFTLPEPRITPTMEVFDDGGEAI